MAKTTEEKIWEYLSGKIGNNFGAAGLMGNLSAESGLRSNNAQNSCMQRMKMTDEEYTAQVDSGAYTQFASDSVGYGLAQWTSSGRKQNLLNHMKSCGKSIADLDGQLDFLIRELQTSYKKVWNTLKSASSVKEASDSVLTGFERPADQSAAAKRKRADYGQTYYDKYALKKEETTAMGVRVGSARSNESGGINGGAAGDQTGKEVSTQAWYLHSKGWIVLRAKDAAAREKIAHNMESICSNDNIGYCQNHRSTLTAAAKPYGYDAAKVASKVEVDCSEAVRNCVMYAGISAGAFNTASEASVLVSTGQFDKLTDDKYCKSSDYLLRGDILVTKTKGHTVVVLDNGPKASGSAAAAKPVPAAPSSVKIDSAKSKDAALAGTYTVTASSLNIRTGAGTTKKSLGTLPNGSKVKCYGYYTAAAGTKWLLVVANGITGFCSGKYLKKI